MHVTIAWSVRLSHSCTLLKLLDGMRVPFGSDIQVVRSNIGKGRFGVVTPVCSDAAAAYCQITSTLVSFTTISSSGIIAVNRLTNTLTVKKLYFFCGCTEFRSITSGKLKKPLHALNCVSVFEVFYYFANGYCGYFLWFACQADTAAMKVQTWT